MPERPTADTELRGDERSERRDEWLNERLTEVLDRLSGLEDEVARTAGELNRQTAVLSEAIAEAVRTHAEKLDLIDEALAGWTEDIERAIAESSGSAAVRTELLGARLAIRSAVNDAAADLRAATPSVSASDIAAAVGEIVPAAMASSLSQLIQTSFETAESSRAAMIDAIRKDLIALATTIKSATDAAARTVADQAAQAASAAADAAERASNAATELAASARSNAGADVDVTAQLADLGQRIDALAEAIALGDRFAPADAEDATRERVASDVSERLARLREAAAGVGDAVRAEARRRRRP